MNLNDFKRLIQPLRNKIFLLLGRAILEAVKNTELTQKIQVTALSGEVITDMERFQEYGFETYPLEGAEVIAVFLNGNRDHGIAVCVHDRRYRPQDLVEGEVIVYTDEDKILPFRIQMKRGRIHFRRSNEENIDIDTNKTEDIGVSKIVTVPTETHVNSIGHIINSPQVMLGGAVWAALRALVDSRFITLFNTHVHSQGPDSDGDVQVNTGAPTVLASEVGQATTKVKGI